MDWKIELIYVPVTDVDRAKDFYVRIGFHADHDQVPFDGLRFVQMTPPGSACSIAFGTGLGNDLEPGQAEHDPGRRARRRRGARPPAVGRGGGERRRRAGVGTVRAPSTTPTATPGRCRNCPRATDRLTGLARSRRLG